MKSILAFLFIVTGVVAYAQEDSVLVRFEIVDKTYKEGIQNVNATLQFNNKTIIRSSNSKGRISVYVPNNVQLNYQLTHPLFESYSGTKKVALKSTGDTSFISVEMLSYKGKTLNSVTVSGLPWAFTVTEFNVLP